MPECVILGAQFYLRTLAVAMAVALFFFHWSHLSDSQRRGLYMLQRLETLRTLA